MAKSLRCEQEKPVKRRKNCEKSSDRKVCKKEKKAVSRVGDLKPGHPETFAI